MSPPLFTEAHTRKDADAFQAVPATLTGTDANGTVASALASCRFPRECHGVWLVPVTLSAKAGASPRLPDDWRQRARQTPATRRQPPAGGWECPVTADFGDPAFAGASAVVVLFLVNNVASVGGVVEFIALSGRFNGLKAARQTPSVLHDEGKLPAQMMTAIERVFDKQDDGLFGAQLSLS